MHAAARCGTSRQTKVPRDIAQLWSAARPATISGRPVLLAVREVDEYRRLRARFDKLVDLRGIATKILRQAAEMIGKMRDQGDRGMNEIAHLLGCKVTAEVLDEEGRLLGLGDDAWNA